MNVFANTNVGLVRKLNEDDYCIAHNANDEWMAIVCDGIGGAKAGEVASHTAVMTMYEAFMKSPVFKKDFILDASSLINNPNINITIDKISNG